MSSFFMKDLYGKTLPSIKILSLSHIFVVNQQPHTPILSGFSIKLKELLGKKIIL